MASVTRCKKCLHKNNAGNQIPCNQCKEIQYKRNGLDNYFLPADKDLMKYGI